MLTQQANGQAVKPSNTEAFDFLLNGKKVELKGPFIDPKTLEPIIDPDIPQIADNILKSANAKSGFLDLFPVDTLGLSDAQAIQLRDLLKGVQNIFIFR